MSCPQIRLSQVPDFPPQKTSIKLREDVSSSSASNDDDESSSMDSESDSSGQSQGPRRGSIDLTLDRLQSMHAVACGYRHDRSSYSANGRSQDRIKNVVNNPICACRQCRVKLSILMKVCLTFWLLSKDGQDSVLWAIQRGNGKKNNWYIEGLVRLMLNDLILNLI